MRSWAKNGLTPTVTANSSVSPDGTTTAELFTRTTTGPTYIQQILVKAASALTYTFSVYAKQSVGNFIALRAQGTYPARADVVFNLSTGAIASAASVAAGFASASATITPLLNGWYRLTLTATTDAVTNLQVVASVNSNGGQVDGTDSVSNSACFLWGAQLEQSATVGEYIPTTSTINSAPRFDHDPTTGESLGLLVEEQRTNLVTNSSATGAAIGTPGTLPTGWSNIGGATGLTSEIAAVGTEDGIPYVDFRFYGTAGNNFLTITPVSGNLGFVTNTSYASSVYTKFVAGAAPTGLTASLRIRYNLSPSGQTDIITNFAMPSAGGLNVNRFFATGTTTGTLTGTGLLFLQLNYSASQVVDFTIRVGYPQLEQGAFATSVIPTTTAAATRAADVASITGSNFSSWYRQDEGTMFAEFVPRTFAQACGLLSLDNGTTSERLQTRLSTNGRCFYVVVDGGSVQANFGTVASTSLNTKGRLATSFAVNSFKVSLNGGSVASDTSGTLPTVAQAVIGNAVGVFIFNGPISRIAFWPRELPESTLQTITQ
jgi:hypothetical protein